MRISYNWLKDYLGEELPSVKDLVNLLTFHAFEVESVVEMEGDTIIDIDILPNRSSDCLSHRGIAKEIATLHGIKLVKDPLNVLQHKIAVPNVDSIFVDIVDENSCGRFTVLLLEDVEIKPSPKWLQDRLISIGQKPINNVVDATNFVMYDLGQPMHAYDADKFIKKDNTWHFRVRPALAGEVIHLISEKDDHSERTINLEGGETLITEGSSDTPVSLAGVKGGVYAGIDKNTTRVLIEAAHFDPSLTRVTARKNNIIIDASKRFENNISPELALYAQHEIAVLLADSFGFKVKGLVDVYPKPKKILTVDVSIKTVNRLLGLDLSQEEVKNILQRIGCSVDEKDGYLSCTPPFERMDLNIPEDYVEEVGRILGYDKIQAVCPDPSPLIKLNKVHYYSEQLRDLLTAHGFSEIITSSFRKKDKIKLLNALASDKKYLRSNLSKNINDALVKNSPHKDLLGLNDVRVFEIGNVMSKGSVGVEERISLAFGAQCKITGYSGKEDVILVDMIKVIEKTLGIQISSKQHKGVVEIDFSRLIEDLPEPIVGSVQKKDVKNSSLTTKVFRPLSSYPSITRDVAFWVPEGESGVVEHILRLVKSDIHTLNWKDEGSHVGLPVYIDEIQQEIYLQRLDLFDVFKQDNYISYGFRLVFQSYNQTLTDESVNQVMETLYKLLKDKGWKVR